MLRKVFFVSCSVVYFVVGYFLFFRDDRLAEIDRHMQSALAPVSSDIIKACLPGGQAKPFPHNCFSLMVLTGAKGSMVNHSQVRFFVFFVNMEYLWL